MGTEIDVRFEHGSVRPEPVATTTTTKRVVGGRGRLAGWSLYDTQGTAGAPATTSVNDGFANAAGTLLTVPANTAWSGRIALTAVLTVAPGGLAVAAAATVSTAAGMTPNAATLVGLDLAAPAAAAAGSGTLDRASPGYWGPDWIINPTGGALNVTLASNATKVDAWAHGQNYTFPGTTMGSVVELYDGEDANGTLMAVVPIPAGGAVHEPLGDTGPIFRIGVFLRVVSGSVRGALWIGAHHL